MKKISKILLLVALCGMTIPMWGQSTQGKEFWVSSTIVCSPNKATATPYIAVSAEKACSVTIQGGVGNAINIVQQVAAGSWNEFGNGTTSQLNPAAGMVKVPMDASKWYPVAMNDASNVRSLAGQTNNYGLHITATENISVYVILSSTNSMDAANILPLTAIGSEYYTQDYWPIVKSDFPNAVSMVTILATENNTQVDITPNGTTYDGHSSLYTVSLNKGQTYYVMSEVNKQMSGTHIVAKNGKKIAVFNGVPLTNVPTNIAARDCLFEQVMPIEYWGTQFVVTRSLEKNGNLIGITATNRNTEIKVNGTSQTYINEGETFYLMLQNSGDPNAKTPGTKPIDMVVTADAAFIETSCPCAVFNYDTGNSYKGATGDEITNSQGDPSSIWVSPVQQKINRITFGTCYTSKTKDHFLNVVTETATCQNTTLTALYGATTLDKTSLLTWTPVPGNTKYSYARAKIGDANTSQFSVFRLENAKGFIATVYGNGNDESYAYSAGSAAVEQGVNVEGETFVNGYRSDTKFCFDSFLSFDAAVGTDEITRVDWNFGDGTTEMYGLPQTEHMYTTPGWYDVRAELYGSQVCSDEDNKHLGTVQFSFRVVRPDTIINQPEHYCISLDGKLPDGTQLTPERIEYLLENGDNDTVQANCASDVYITPVSYGQDIEETLDTIVGRDRADGHNGRTYYSSTDVTDTVPALGKKCARIQHYYVKIITCLDINIPNVPAKQHICPGEKLTLDYIKNKGDIKSARFVVPSESIDEEVPMENGNTQIGLLDVPTQSITKPGTYHSQVLIEDLHCEDKTFDIDFTVNYPSDIFKFKFNNVLAVYNPGYGGNVDYNFAHYEWHLIRGLKDSIIGEDASILYLGTGIPFEEDDIVYVVLTDADGNTLPSCTQTLHNIQDYNEETQKPLPAQKKIVNRQFMIIRGNDIFDIYGQKVK